MRVPTWLMAAAVVAAALAVDAPAWHGAFLWDDPQYVAANPLLRDPAGLARAWFAPGSVMEYYPLQETALWLQWRLFSPEPLGYHLTNALLHALGALLLWRFFAQLGLRSGWLGALLFAVHPANVESVAWISELKNTLSLPPFLVAMTALVRFYDSGRRRDYAVALIAFTLALLVKISMAPFPFAVLLYAWWRNGRVTWRDVRLAAPFLAVALVLSGLTVFAYLSYGATHPDHPAIPPVGGPLARLALSGAAVAFYLGHAILPWPLLPIYPTWEIGRPTWLNTLPWAIGLGLLAILWHRRAGYGRHVLLGLGFFLLLIAPFSGLATQSYFYFTWVMDHLLYLAMIGPLGLAVAAVDVLRRRGRAATCLAVVVSSALVLAFAWEARAYSARWQGAAELWSYNVARAPSVWMAHYNLGNAWRREGRFDAAIGQYRESLALHPDYDWTHNNLGICLAESPDRLPAAMDEYRAALRLRPDFAEAHNNLANALTESGRYEEAFPEFQAALAARPDFIAARYNFALALLKDGRRAEAAVQLREILRQDPGMAAAHFLLDLAR